MTAANTRGCFTEFIGQKVVGVLFDALPPHRADLRQGNTTLVFEDGRGLTVSSNGSYGIDSERDIQTAIRAKEKELREAQGELAGVLDLAGASHAE